MSSHTAGVDGPHTLKLRNHHLTVLVSPEDGRILEVVSMRTGRHLVSWWPFKLADPERAGGIGERTLGAGAPPYTARELPDRISLTRTLPGGVTVKKAIYLPPDASVFHVSIAVANASETAQAVTIDQVIAACPGFGGACPRPESGILNCRHKAFLKAVDGPVREVTYEVFQRVHVERDGLEWAVFNDPLTDNLLCVVLPGGHCVLRTEYHWWLEWRREVRLGPGESVSVDFHYGCAPSVDLPLVANEHILAGIRGEMTPLDAPSRPRLRVFGMDTASGGSGASVSVDHKTLVDGKPLPDVREPVEVELPEWRGEGERLIEVSVAGRYGAVAIEARACREAYAELVRICDGALAAAERGELPRSKTAIVLACKRIVDLNRDKSPETLLGIIEEASRRANCILESPLDGVAFYSEAECRWQVEAARRIDIAKTTGVLVDELSRDYDLSMPRFREGAGGSSVFGLTGALLEAALVLSVNPDERLMHIFKSRFAELAAMWGRYGAILYETIHHGVLLSRLVPAYSIALRGAWLTRAEEIEAGAMILDLCDKIRRRGGVQFQLSNWWAMESAALAYVGALFGYLPEAAEYLRRARETFYWLLVHGTFGDGGFWEMSPSYHAITLEYLSHIAEAFLRAGTDLYDCKLCGRRLSEMATYLAKMSVPPGALPAFEDSSRSVSGGLFLTLAKRFGDGQLLFLADCAFEREGKDRGARELFVAKDAPKPVVPGGGSYVMVPSGKAVLRSSDARITMVVDFGAHGGWHGHNDKLSFELYRDGKCLAPDAGNYRYEEALQWTWFKTSAAHNTVTLGEENQRETCGRLVDFVTDANGSCVVVEAETYPGVLHRREINVAGNAVTVEDVIKGAPDGATLVWRMNSFAPVSVAGNIATVMRSEDSFTVKALSDDVEITVAPAPLMGERSEDGGEYVKGWQVRAAKRVAHKSERILMRLEFKSV